MSNLDTFVLNGLNLNDETNFGLEALDLTPPAKRSEWALSADADGQGLIRTPLFENRTITVTLRIGKQASMNAALEKLGALVDQFQEAEKNPEGIALEYQPAKSTKLITFYVLTGFIAEIPMVNEGAGSGWYVEMPAVKVVLTARPFGYGTEEEVLAAKSIETGLSVVVGTIANVKGDVPAEGRLVIKDTAGVGRRFVEWGLENRYYNAGTSLILDSHEMTAVGGAGSEAAKTGAYKPSGEATIATTLPPEPTICANTGVLKHIGSFRVKARVQAVLGAESLAENVHVRLSYQDGEGPLRANAWQTPNLGGKFVEVDLGEITLTEKLTGTQKWLGQIEAYSENTAVADVLHIDYLVFIPLEGYGKARGVQSSAPGTVVAFDNFTTGTLSGNLNARTPAVGAAWATSGTATDWTVEKGAAMRTTKTDTEPRFGVLGSAIGNNQITVQATISGAFTGENGATLFVILRWTDASNYVALQVTLSASHPAIFLFARVAGVNTTLAHASVPILTPSGNTFGAVFTALLDGSLSGTVFDLGPQTIQLSASSAAVATGGALASGKGGVATKSAVANDAQRIESVSIASLPAIPYCIQPERSMEARSDSTITADSTGTYYGPVPEYRGSRFYVPQAGSAKRTSRIIVKADRNDLEEADEQTIADPFTAQVLVTPRYLAIPR